MSADCTPATCGCKARTSKEAAEKAAQHIGLDPATASALLYLLREYGWTLTQTADHAAVSR